MLCLGVLAHAQDEQLPITYSAGFNAWIGSENVDDSGSPAEGLVSSSSYNIQANIKMPTKKEGSWLPFFNSTQQYISLRAVKFRTTANDGDYEWLENLQALGVVYGRRHFIQDGFNGFNFGWYLGVALANTDGYEWPLFMTNPTIEPYQEDLLLLLNSIEVSYHLEWKFLFVEPTFSVYVNSTNGTFAYYPSIIVGVQMAK